MIFVKVIRICRSYLILVMNKFMYEFQHLKLIEIR